MEATAFFILMFIVTITIKNISKPKKKSNKYNKPKRKSDYATNMTNNFINNQPTLMSVSDIAIYFNISAGQLNTILEELQWQEKSGKWIIATRAGEWQGAKEKYNTKSKQKYIMWDSKIKYNEKLINAVKEFKTIKESKINNITKNKKMSNEEKKKKGDIYEEYISNFFREQGYYVWEVGKEKGVKDSGVDIFVKKENIIYFVQCKNWETWKLNHNTVQAIQTKVRNFMKQEKGLTKLANGFKKKILYVTPNKCLTKGAYKYIEENSDILEYQVIAMNKN